MTSVALSEPSRAMVQKALPGYMLALAIASLEQRTRHTLRQDYKELVNKASILPLQGLDVEMQKQTAHILESEGYMILKAAGTDAMKMLVIAVCMMLVAFQNRGVQIEENAMLVALALIGEATEDEQEPWGKVSQIKPMAIAMENEARSRGFFSHLVLVE